LKGVAENTLINDLVEGISSISSCFLVVFLLFFLLLRSAARKLKKVPHLLTKPQLLGAAEGEQM